MRVNYLTKEELLRSFGVGSVFQQCACGLKDLGGKDLLHAVVMFEGASALLAGGTGEISGNDSYLRVAPRRGALIVGGAEDGDRGHGERAGDMHGAGVVGDEKIEAGDVGEEFGHGATDDVTYVLHTSGLKMFFNFCDDLPILGAAEEDEVVRGGEFESGFGKTLRKPPFGIAVGSARVDADGGSIVLLWFFDVKRSGTRWILSAEKSVEDLIHGDSFVRIVFEWDSIGEQDVVPGMFAGNPLFGTGGFHQQT